MRTQRWKELNREKHGKIGTRRKKAGFKNILKRDLSKNKSKKKKIKKIFEERIQTIKNIV